jgi:hypothetical protein
MVLICVANMGCTNAKLSQFAAYGSDFKVTVYSGGEPVRTYTSSGKVATEEHSDGWYFTDKETKKLVRVSGTVTVEQL